MDYAPALPPLFDYLWYLIPLFIPAAVIKSFWFKDKAGEPVGNRSAKLSLDKTCYHLIKNVALSTEDGTTQIDHIIVSRHGIFVGDSTFKTPMPEIVTHGGGYVRYIKAQTELRLADVEARKVIETIESGRLAATFKNHRNHVKHASEVVAKKNSEPRCPKFQGEMVKRTAKRGENIGKEFYGCKAFPKCRGMVGASLLQ